MTYYPKNHVIPKHIARYHLRVGQIIEPSATTKQPLPKLYTTKGISLTIFLAALTALATTLASQKH